MFDLQKRINKGLESFLFNLLNPNVMHFLLIPWSKAEITAVKKVKYKIQKISFYFNSSYENMKSDIIADRCGSQKY